MPKFRINSKNFAMVLIAALVIVGVIIGLVIGSDKKSNPAPKPKTSQNTVNTDCGPYHKDGVVTVNGHQINVEIAYDDKAKQTGLAGRPCIDSNWGMLFDFGHDGQYAFWMKGMEFPIDVVWINSRHNVAAIEINFKPSTYNKQNPNKSERRGNQSPARYVLELKANQTKVLKIGLGTPIHFQKI